MGWWGRFAALGLMVCAAPAWAGNRIALVIGNQSYARDVGPLRNPVRDATLVKAALEHDGFEVELVTNAGRTTMLAAVDRYARKLKAAGGDAIGFFYYSGHGAANDGKNYLIPTDVTNAATDEIWYDSVKLDEIVGAVHDAAAGNANVVVFDACREALQLPPSRGIGGGGSKGLESIPQVSSLLIAYSTSPRALAIDGVADATSGPYAGALASALVTPGLDLAAMFDRVKYEVLGKTNNRQQPWIEDGLTKHVYLAGEPSIAQAPAAAVAAAGPVAPATKVIRVTAAEALAWKNASRLGTAGAYRSFLARFPAGGYADDAQAKLLALPSAARPATPGHVVTPVAAPARPGVPATWGLSAGDLTALSDRELLQKAHVPAQLGAVTAAAGRGDALASLLLGMSYQEGFGIGRNPAEATIWLQKAADARLPRGRVALAALVAAGHDEVAPDPKGAIATLQEVAAAGEPQAMVQLATMYIDGSGVDQDFGQAVSWYRRAAAAGSADAMLHLGDAASDGQLVAQNPAEALDWYQKAAAAGSGYAMLRLGQLYLDGRGVVQDDAQAVAWLKKSVDAGIDDGAVSLGDLYLAGRGGAANPGEALRLFRRAGDAGNAAAMRRVGAIYAAGATGVPRDEAQAQLWYNRAIAGGDLIAMRELAAMFLAGPNGGSDPAQGLRLLNQAATAGDAAAMMTLGGMYEHGTGVTLDAGEAMRWYKAAGDKGEPTAAAAIARLTAPAVATPAAAPAAATPPAAPAARGAVANPPAAAAPAGKKKKKK